MAFNWDDHPVVNTPAPGPAPAKAFSWDDHPIVESAPPPQESMGRQLTRAAIDTVLPVGGAIGAGLMATPESLGLASIPAAAAGYAGGKQAARVLKHYVLGDDVGATDASGLVKQTAKDLGEGAIAEAGGQVISKGLEAAAPAARSLAERFTGRALGAERATVRSLGLDKIKAAGGQALDEGVLSPLASTDDMIARNEAIKARGGAKMNQAYSAIDDAGASTFNPLEVASKVDAELSPAYRTPINKGETSQLDNTIESILARANKAGDNNIPLTEAQSLKEELGAVAYPKGKAPIDPTPKQQMAMDAYRIVNKSIDEAAQAGSDSIGQDGLKELLQSGKSLYGNAKTAEKLLQNKQAREEGNKILGLTDYGVLTGGGIAATATGGTALPITLAALGAKKGLERYGSQNAALALNGVSKFLMKNPVLSQIAEKSPAAFQSIVSHLENQGVSFPLAADSGQQTASVPSKGPAKWTNDGIDNLVAHADDPNIKDQLVSAKDDPKTKDLLIQASDLKPGSKALEKVLSQIKNRLAKGDK